MRDVAISVGHMLGQHACDSVYAAHNTVMVGASDVLDALDILGESADLPIKRLELYLNGLELYLNDMQPYLDGTKPYLDGLKLFLDTPQPFSMFDLDGYHLLNPTQQVSKHLL